MILRPPHEVRDSEKLEQIKNDMKANSWVGRPILAIDLVDYKQALTGSHRIASATEIELEIPTVTISNELFTQICDECDWDLDMVMRDLNGFYRDLKDYDADMANLLSEDL